MASKNEKISFISFLLVRIIQLKFLNLDALSLVMHIFWFLSHEKIRNKGASKSSIESQYRILPANCSKVIWLHWSFAWTWISSKVSQHHFMLAIQVSYKLVQISFFYEVPIISKLIVIQFITVVMTELHHIFMWVLNFKFVSCPRHLFIIFPKID